VEADKPALVMLALEVETVQHQQVTYFFLLRLADLVEQQPLHPLVMDQMV
jgi:hypothetical protein